MTNISYVNTRLKVGLLLFICWIPKLSVAQEICDNGRDDDNNGLIDINDPACVCEIVEPVSFIPNPSFEDLNCCPSGRSQLNCADVWIQASEPTTDLIHTCDWLGWDDFPPPRPFPDGDGIMGFRDGRVRGNSNSPEQNWKEYAGACLLTPLEKDSLYRFEFDVGFVNAQRSPPINITFFGTSDCNNLPFGGGNEDFGCPTNGSDWVNLGSTFLTGGTGNKWVKANIDVVPDQQITAIAIGPECQGIDTDVSLYYFFDDLLLSDVKSFDLRISPVTHACSDQFALKVGDNSSFTYQWYKNGIALVGETFSQLQANYEAGEYQVRIDDGASCKLSGNYTHTIPVFSETIFQTICAESSYSFGENQLNVPGTYIDTFKTLDNCINVVTLNLKVLGEVADTVAAKIFEGETYSVDQYNFKRKGDHLVSLTSNKGCDSLVLLQLDYFEVYFPNVFSPNFDGLNDRFSVLSEAGLVEQTDLTIYNRWGVQVFKGSEWDGRHQGKLVNSGVFIFLANVTMNDGIVRQFSGDITVLR